MSERFDVDLVAAVLTALPDWTLTVHGPAGVPAARTAGRFRDLERRFPGRFTHRGLPRGRLPAMLDAATVALIPDAAGRALRGSRR
ncbi:hypothetical protein SAMN05661080_01455 [Modestobacter sp. DSM 44400]|uniref:hypothetical protein n=1 Tax=Modestobacter sp. DSM 44400 TaxID=1550230 RepID=UPI00089919BC|nr:hypothetical protein [Modestobacter sp. DSM 44400]SDX84904.1 hypothetical protein SAMN05661080_01455 [Modestobacter sp. DSM 44400]